MPQYARPDWGVRSALSNTAPSLPSVCQLSKRQTNIEFNALRVHMFVLAINLNLAASSLIRLSQTGLMHMVMEIQIWLLHVVKVET